MPLARASRRWEDVGSEADATIRGISASAVDADESNELWVTTSDFLKPSSLGLCDASAGPEAVVEPLKSLPPQFDASGLTTAQGEATSADGTKVPMAFFNLPLVPSPSLPTPLPV